MLLKRACPLHWLWQRHRVGDIATLPELHNLSLALLFFYYGKSRICKVYIALRSCLETTSPAYHIDEATFVAVDVGNTECIDIAMLEGRKCHTQCCVKSSVKPQ